MILDIRDLYIQLIITLESLELALSLYNLVAKR